MTAHLSGALNSQFMTCHTSSFFFFFFCLYAFSKTAPLAYRGSQARGLIGAVAPGLCQSHSNPESELRLQPTQQLTARLDP